MRERLSEKESTKKVLHERERTIRERTTRERAVRERGRGGHEKRGVPDREKGL